MKEVDRLLEEVAQAQARFLASVSGLSPAQAAFKPEPARWSILEITEHIVRAEQAGVSGMWRSRNGLIRCVARRLD